MMFVKMIRFCLIFFLRVFLYQIFPNTPSFEGQRNIVIDMTENDIVELKILLYNTFSYLLFLCHEFEAIAFIVSDYR